MQMQRLWTRGYFTAGDSALRLERHHGFAAPRNLRPRRLPPSADRQQCACGEIEGMPALVASRQGPLLLRGLAWYRVVPSPSPAIAAMQWNTSCSTHKR